MIDLSKYDYDDELKGIILEIYSAFADGFEFSIYADDDVEYHVDHLDEVGIAPVIYEINDDGKLFEYSSLDEMFLSFRIGDKPLIECLDELNYHIF